MGDSHDNEIPLALRRAAGRFARWRRTRRVGMRIPEPLWQLASRLAADFGVSRTATLLGLDYYALRRRMESASPAQRALSKPAFVELPGSTLASAGEYVLEFENAAGSKLRVHCQGGAVPDLVGLARSLWNAGT